MVFRVKYNPKAIRTLIQTMRKRTWVGEDAFEVISIKIADSKSGCLRLPKNDFLRRIAEIFFTMKAIRLFVLTIPMLLTSSAFAQEAKPLFDGKTFEGWEGNTKTVWRIDQGALTAGSLTERQKDNDFLATTTEYQDFELELEWKLEGTEGFINGGVQFRTKRIPNHHEVSGYQADLGAGFDGALYDESRRNKILAKPDAETLKKAIKPLGQWNHYRIRAQGDHIQLWLNGIQTVDYKEIDPGIEPKGIIAVQIHGGATAIARYRKLTIKELK
jgi:hypothetical protein